MSRSGKVKVTYENNRGNKIVLTDFPYYLDVEPLFDYKWTYSSRNQQKRNLKW